jgi:pyruvate dehydrogenase E2 component (dihydrolipoamide acetyltransferase)
MSGAEQQRNDASLTAYIAWITAQILIDHPLLNAALHNDEILVFDTINLGIAVDTDEGLIVPVIHEAHHLSLEDIDTAVRDLSHRSRTGQLSLGDVSGGTFTISNLGMMSVDRFEAIINPPQAAIMAVGQTRLRPWVVGQKKIVARPIMTVTVSADHRIVDGAAVARFMQDLQFRLGSDA